MEDRMSFYVLNNIRKKHNLFTAFGIICILFAVFSVFLSVIQGIFALFGIITMVIGIVLLVKRGKVKKEFNAIYKNEVVKAVLDRHFEDVYYNYEHGFDRNYVMNMTLITSGNRYRTEDYLRAKYRGVNFEQADVVIENETTDSDGNSTTTTYFRGRIIVIDFPKQTEFVRTTSKKFGYTRHLRKGEYPYVEMENVVFNKNFYTYARDSVEAFYILTPQMMEKLMEIVGTYGNVGVSCFGGKMNIAINTKRDAFDAKMTRSLQYDREMNDLDQDAALIENLIEIIYSTQKAVL